MSVRGEQEMGINLKPWDGKDKSGRYQYPLKEIRDWDMTIDDEGNIWYYTHEDIPKLNLWCTAKRLTSHMHHLEQIKYRR